MASDDPNVTFVTRPGNVQATSDFYNNHMINEKQYKAYLLRLQRSQENAHWRTTLENAHTGEVLRFHTEAECLRYLLRTLEINLLIEEVAPTNSIHE